MVRGAGLEPASLAALEPKSRAFANFANRAENLRYYNTESTTFKPPTEKSPFRSEGAEFMPCISPVNKSELPAII